MDKLPFEALANIIGQLSPELLTGLLSSGLRNFSLSCKRHYEIVTEEQRHYEVVIKPQLLRILGELFSDTSLLDAITKKGGHTVLFGEALPSLLEGNMTSRKIIGLAVMGLSRETREDMQLRKRFLETLRGEINKKTLHVKLDSLNVYLNIDNILSRFVWSRNCFLSADSTTASVLSLGNGNGEDMRLVEVSHEPEDDRSVLISSNLGYVLFQEDSTNLVRLDLAKEEPFRQEVTIAAMRELHAEMGNLKSELGLK